MAIKYPGQTLQQYGNATVIQTSKAYDAGKTAIASLQAQKKQQAAAAQNRQKLEREIMNDLSDIKIREADQEFAMTAYENLSNLYKELSPKIAAGDTDAIMQFQKETRKLQNIFQMSANEREIEKTEYQKVLGKDYNHPYNINTFEQKRKTSMFAPNGTLSKAWAGEEVDGNFTPGIGDFQLYENIELGDYYKDYIVNELIVDSVSKANLGAEVSDLITGFNIEMTPSTKAAIAQGSIAYNNKKGNMLFIDKLDQQMNDNNFLSNIPNVFKEIIANPNNSLEDKRVAVSAANSYLASPNKDLFKLITTTQGADYSEGEDNEFTSNLLTSVTESRTQQYYLPIATSLSGASFPGMTESFQLDLQDEDSKSKIAGMFGYKGFKEWEIGSGFELSGTNHVLSMKKGGKITLNLPGDIDLDKNTVNFGEGFSVPVLKFKDVKDGVYRAGVRSDINLSKFVPEAVTSRQVAVKDIDLALTSDGQLVDWNDSYKNKAYRIKIDEGGYIPKLYLDSPAMKGKLFEQGYIDYEGGVPMIEGRTSDGHRVGIPLPLNDDGSLNSDAETKILMDWFRNTLSGSTKMKGEDIDNQVDLFREYIESLAPKVRK